MQKNEMFTSRMGLILASLGMALGTGNIWRFPRIVAQNAHAIVLPDLDIPGNNATD